jgi:hypothetical protein
MTDIWYAIRKIDKNHFYLVQIEERLGETIEFISPESLYDGDKIEVMFLNQKRERKTHTIFHDHGVLKIFIIYCNTFIPIAIIDLPQSILLRIIN